MQAAAESLAAIVSSNELKDAATRPVPFPSEERILGLSRHLGRSLGQARFIETQGVSTPPPKRLTVEGKEGSSAATRCRFNKHEFGVAIPEPDPPDKRKRPRGQIGRRRLSLVLGQLLILHTRTRSSVQAPQ